jgi:hypothetical protein
MLNSEDDDKVAATTALGSSKPVLESFAFGDTIDWSSPLAETLLYVELPFWLMTSPGRVEVEWSGTTFGVDVCSQWMEVFAGLVRDSRASVIHQGPWRPNGWEPSEDNAAELERLDVMWLQRPCKTVLRLATRAHESALRELGDNDNPRARSEQNAYLASLCEAHVPVVNELIQRYRLVTYDYFTYEVSAWDVPVWYVKHNETHRMAVLLPYKEWDLKPVTIEEADTPGGRPKIQTFEFATLDAVTAMASTEASPGEFDLLDARSLMERGDYTGAVRRTVTAIEAVLRWALVNELSKNYSAAEAETRAAHSDNDFPGRLRQWRKLARPQITQQEFDEFEATRAIRHEIVHRGRRLTHEERGRAQRAVDTGRWLYNKIEGRPDRARLRDYGTLRSVGRVALAPRFPSRIDAQGISLGLDEP